MKKVVQDLTSGGIDWQREKWQSGLGSKFIHQGEKNAAKSFGLCIRHLQHTGAIAGFGLIAPDGKVLIYFRAVIVEGVLCTVQRYVRIRHKPLFVAITEDLVERAVQHFFHRNAFHIRHFRIAIAENEIYAAAVLVKDKLYHAECQRHIVQQAAFFQHTQGLGLRVCQPYFCAQAAMTAQAALLKDWYPKFGMREMADNDILFDASKRKEVKAIFQGRGYTVKGYNKSNHDEYEKPPIYSFEMHIELYHKIYDTFNEKYADVKQRLIPDAEVPYRFHFTPEDFYVFVIAHAYKHYSRSGTGIRTLADIYIMNQKLGGTLNWEYVDSELRGLGIFSYEHESRELARKIFGIAELPTKANLSEAEQQMLAYYLGASTYGTIENRILNQMQKLQPDDGAFTARTKRKYLLSRIFPGREWCKAYAPTVYKYPALLPFFWVWRLIYKGITNRKKVTQEIKTIKAGKQN